MTAMAIFYAAFAVLVAVVVWILFYYRYYQKANSDTVLIRTGSGGRKVVVDGGCLVLPFLHHVQKVNMRAVPVTVGLTGKNSAITSDRLRVDIEMEFLIRIDPSPEKVVIAAQALGPRVSDSEDLSSFVGGRLLDAMQAAAATYTMDNLHEERQKYAAAIHLIVSESISRLGLVLEDASLKRMDQAPFSSFDENNVFNAVGMRHLTQVIAENRKQRVQIEAEADVTVRQSQLEQARQKIDIERQQKHYEIEMRRQSEEMEAEAEAQIAKLQAESESAVAAAKIGGEQSTKAAEIERDRSLRKHEMDAMLELETKKIDHAIAMSAKRAQEIVAQAESEAARTSMVEATEKVQKQKEVSAAERAKEVALLKAKEQTAVESERSQARAGVLLAMAQAEAEAEKTKLLAESEGKTAVIQAENQASDALMTMKLKMHHLDKLPEIAAMITKPMEKIESIRINQIGGTGGKGESGSPMNQAIESMLGMAVQLPALKNLGEEIGVDFDANLAGRVHETANRARAAYSPEKKGARGEEIGEAEKNKGESK